MGFYEGPNSCVHTLCMPPHQTNKVVSICQRLHTSVVVFRSVRQTVRMEKICTTRAFVEFDGHFVTFFLGITNVVMISSLLSLQSFIGQ